MKKPSNVLQIHSIYGYLHSTTLFLDIGESGDYEYFVTMTLTTDLVNQSKKTIVKFVNVKQFTVGEVNGIWLSQLDIVDISAHQMENINFRVTDGEHGMFSFYCESFTLEELE